ncbi:MAG TPA: hypothetical protein VM261_12315 [Kofleriaceae bacterium]|nr:hypothetical protein [Kofleriaceae bacterium]
MKKIAWTITMAMASAAGAALAGRAAGMVWRMATNEAPPEMPWWARWLVARPIKAGVGGAISAPG